MLGLLVGPGLGDAEQRGAGGWGGALPQLLLFLTRSAHRCPLEGRVGCRTQGPLGLEEHLLTEGQK